MCSRNSRRLHIHWLLFALDPGKYETLILSYFLIQLAYEKALKVTLFNILYLMNCVLFSLPILFQCSSMPYQTLFQVYPGLFAFQAHPAMRAQDFSFFSNFGNKFIWLWVIFNNLYLMYVLGPFLYTDRKKWARETVKSVYFPVEKLRKVFRAK